MLGNKHKITALEKALNKELPLITIGIPIKNRAWCIDKLLKAIDSLDYPKNRVKLVFVDDYSTDGTFEILEEWKDRVKERFYDIVLIRERTNIPQARNICIKNMEGEYLLFWDSDVIPPPDLLRIMVEEMEKDPTIGVIGADYIYESNVKYEPTTNRETRAVYMGFTLIRREVFDKVEGFNEKLSVGEDTEFCIRVKELTQYKIVWAPKPVLHLKRPEDRRTLYEWLRYNYHVRAREYLAAFSSLPFYLKGRIFYYLALPWMVVIAPAMTPMLIPIVAGYLALSIYPVVRQRGLRYGIYTWLTFNLPTGLTLSYGILAQAVVTLIRRLVRGVSR